MDLAVAGNNAAKGLFWSSSTTAAFDKLWSSSSFEKARSSLELLAIEGKVTAAVLSDPAYADFIAALEDMGANGSDTGVGIDELANHINSLAKESEETATDLKSLSSSLKTIEQSHGVLESVLADIKDSGNLSLSTLQKMLDLYPELESEVGLYSAGILTSAEMLDIIQKNGKLIVGKNQLSNAFYKGLLKSNSQWVKQFADKYGIDLSNYKTLAEAKLGIEKQLVSSLGAMWQKYYDAQSNALNADAVKASRDLGHAQARGDA